MGEWANAETGEVGLMLGENGSSYISERKQRGSLRSDEEKRISTT